MTSYFVGYNAAMSRSAGATKWLGNLGTRSVNAVAAREAVDQPPDEHAQPQAPTNSALEKAVAAIVNLIPAEGVAVYVGIYGLLLSVAQTTALKNAAALGVLLVAVAVNVFAVILGAVRGHQAHPRRKVPARKVAWRSIVVTILLLVYVSAQPGNPFEAFFGLSTAVGVAIAVVLNIIIGMIAGTAKENAAS